LHMSAFDPKRTWHLFKRLSSRDTIPFHEPREAMRRREFIKIVAGLAAGRPLTARAQQPAKPVIGFLNGGSPGGYALMVAAFREGLKEGGYVEGENVVIEFHWAEGKYDRLEAMAADLVRHQVTVIAATSTPAAHAAKLTTSTIPIVFTTGANPVQLGLVASLNRPGGNVTEVSFLVNELTTKQFEMLHKLTPKADLFGFLVNPAFEAAASQTGDAQDAARALGLRLLVLNVKTPSEIDVAFAGLVKQQAGGLVTISEPFLNSRRDQIVALAARHSLPVLYPARDYVVAGGLMSYGTSIIDAYRQVGVYTGRILKGEKPSDLPVLRPTKLELVINLKTAKTIGLEVPPAVLALADEVIE
jgi:putative tryptophan/tyrosine transport system substrate-binding protein